MLINGLEIIGFSEEWHQESKQKIVESETSAYL
jgi:hypothetical protein